MQSIFILGIAKLRDLRGLILSNSARGEKRRLHGGILEEKFLKKKYKTKREKGISFKNFKV